MALDGFRPRGVLALRGPASSQTRILCARDSFTGGSLSLGTAGGPRPRRVRDAGRERAEAASRRRCAPTRRGSARSRRMVPAIAPTLAARRRFRGAARARAVAAARAHAADGPPRGDKARLPVAGLRARSAGGLGGPPPARDAQRASPKPAYDVRAGGGLSRRRAVRHGARPRRRRRRFHADPVAERLPQHRRRRPVARRVGRERRELAARRACNGVQASPTATARAAPPTRRASTSSSSTTRSTPTRRSSFARRPLVPTTGRMLAPVNVQQDYWFSQTFRLLDQSGKVYLKRGTSGGWQVTFQPDFTEPNCQGQWCPQFRGASDDTLRL